MSSEWCKENHSGTSQNASLAMVVVLNRATILNLASHLYQVDRKGISVLAVLLAQK